MFFEKMVEDFHQIKE